MGALLLLAWPIAGTTANLQKSASLENYSAENGFSRPLPLTQAAQKTTVTKATPSLNKTAEKAPTKKTPKRYSLVTKRKAQQQNGVVRQKQPAPKANVASKSTAKTKAKPKKATIPPVAKKSDPNIAIKECIAQYKAEKFKKALISCQQAAELNDANAQYNLAKLYSKGVSGSEPDYIKAIQYATLAANQNHAEAQFLLALCYQTGIGVTRDKSASLNWYQQAVKNGLNHAKNIDDNHPTNKDPLANVSWPGSEEYKIALIELKHDETRKQAVLTLKQAAEKGHPIAQYQLAIEYMQGEHIAQDDAKAIYWLTKAAEKNHQLSQSYLAWMNLLGLGTKPNNQAAINLFLESRQANLTNDDVDILQEKLTQLTSPDIAKKTPTTAKQRLAELQHGIQKIEVHQQANPEELAVVTQAAQQNSVKAMLYLANLYEQGDKVPQNMDLSNEWYQRAANAGSSEAQYALGWHYYHGQGLPKNNQLALKWFHEASMAGDQRAKNAEAFLLAQEAALTPKAPVKPTIGSKVKVKVNENVQGLFNAVGLSRFSNFKIFKEES